MASAAAFGSGDFAGGVAARRASGLAVAGAANAIGCVLLLVAVVILAPPAPPLEALLGGAVAGIAGGVGLVALYRGLAIGAMGIVSALAASGSIALALLLGTLLGEGVGPLQLAGVGCTMAAAAAASAVGGGRGSRSSLLLAAVAAVGFGLWYVIIDLAAEGAPLWALTSSRATSSLLIGGAALATGRLMALRPVWPVVGVSGLMDVAGNGLFVAARETIAIGLAAALSGIYPLATALLARAVLGERLSRFGLAAVGLALTGIILISLGG